MAALFMQGSRNGSILFGHLGRFIVAMIDGVSAWNDNRVTRNALSKLTDRELEDIGLCRGDIDSVGRL
ncbi:DUF1127 domain-containing protein [Pseudooceanicola nanhaiensis]|jgi:uncharacterized protein YjiS (DUF1127 family)|uniref:YjiS-like domain-containing protein n=2 Tax=Pseudooceanicola nanhaiensis TaxID=375761 RepID=A0A917SY16_9RHOB|nr:DUF1127 domain-containing protein [Pseudooceanicola nanhaiensis]GGM03419.1 hypothetical protein GCM10011534_26530 [Pseudooceanicola nanhaiensis]